MKITFRKWICHIFCKDVLCVLQVSEGGKLNEEMMATVEFTNPFTFNLEGVYIRMEGPGIMPPKLKYYR